MAWPPHKGQGPVHSHRTAGPRAPSEGKQARTGRNRGPSDQHATCHLPAPQPRPGREACTGHSPQARSRHPQSKQGRALHHEHQGVGQHGAPATWASQVHRHSGYGGQRYQVAVRYQGLGSDSAREVCLVWGETRERGGDSSFNFVPAMKDWFAMGDSHGKNNSVCGYTGGAITQARPPEH